MDLDSYVTALKIFILFHNLQDMENKCTGEKSSTITSSIKRVRGGGGGMRGTKSDDVIQNKTSCWDMTPISNMIY